MINALLLLLSLLLAVACGVFVAAEFSLTTVRPPQLEQAAADGERGAGSALKAVRELGFELSGAQLGITVTGLVIGMLAEPAAAGVLSGPLAAAGLGAAAPGAALALGTALASVVLMVVGELVPKNWAISRPLAVAKAVAPPQRAFTAAFRPLIAHLNRTANRVLRRFGIEPAEELASGRSRRELEALARHSARLGALEPDTAELFVRTLNLADLTAENVMTPRVRVTALDARATAQDLANAARATGLSRFPVYRDSLDEVVGIVHIKDLLALPAERRAGCPVTELMREPLLVPESLTVDRLLDLLSGEQSMAVVIDEYGGTAGVATLEDIVEEVVGEVRDEHDRRQLPDLALTASDAPGRRTYDADGAARIDQVEEIGLRVPSGPYETLAGLVAYRLGRIPAVGDTVQESGWTLSVSRTSRHRAARLRLVSPEARRAGQVLGPEHPGSGRDRGGPAQRRGPGDPEAGTGGAADPGRERRSGPGAGNREGGR